MYFYTTTLFFLEVFEVIFHFNIMLIFQKFVSKSGRLQPAVRGPKHCGEVVDLIERQIALWAERSLALITLITIHR